MTHTILIGEVVVDVPLGPNKGGNTTRLGGIIHAARALGAIGADFSIYYISPDYLDEAIVKITTSTYGAKEAVKLGTVSGSPNIIYSGLVCQGIELR